jgi:hypothetical protein
MITVSAQRPRQERSWIAATRGGGRCDDIREILSQKMRRIDERRKKTGIKR